jgi:hypothetical protein
MDPTDVAGWRPADRPAGCQRSGTPALTGRQGCRFQSAGRSRMRQPALRFGACYFENFGSTPISRITFPAPSTASMTQSMYWESTWMDRVMPGSTTKSEPSDS